eukprot:4192808-Pyramimonas_sp.AAC.1
MVSLWTHAGRLKQSMGCLGKSIGVLRTSAMIAWKAAGCLEMPMEVFLLLNLLGFRRKPNVREGVNWISWGTHGIHVGMYGLPSDVHKILWGKYSVPLASHRSRKDIRRIP